MMPAFSPRRDAPARREVGVVAADAGDDRDVAVDDVGRVVAAEQADLDDGDVDRRRRRTAEGRSVTELERRRRTSSIGSSGGDSAQRLGERVVVDRMTVEADALVDPLRCGLMYVPTRRPWHAQQR